MSAYSGWNVPQLRKECRERGIKSCMGSRYIRKNTLISILNDNDNYNSSLLSKQPISSQSSMNQQSIRPISSQSSINRQPIQPI